MDSPIPIERFEVFATGLDHPECLAFDRDGYLWAGGEAGQIYRISTAGTMKTVATLGGFTGGIAFSPDDELCVCNPSLGIVHVRRDGSHEVFATHAGEHKLHTPNFPVFDRHGNLYVTDSGPWKQQQGRLARFTPDGVGKVIGGRYGYANGLALTADDKHLFMAETDSRRIYRFALSDEGSVVSEEVFADDVGRMPDGLALDESGALYVACYASDDIYRIVSPHDEPTRLAHDPDAILLSRPTNVAFDGEWMYVANLGRTTITRARVGVKGQSLVNRI